MHLSLDNGTWYVNGTRRTLTFDSNLPWVNNKWTVINTSKQFVKLRLPFGVWASLCAHCVSSNFHIFIYCYLNSASAIESSALAIQAVRQQNICCRTPAPSMSYSEKGIWPDHTPLAHKLYGSLGDLRCTATFMKETGVSIWRTRRRYIYLHIFSHSWFHEEEGVYTINLSWGCF